MQGGQLIGVGSIVASIVNNAMIRPALGAGGLAITGNLSLLSGSNLSFQLGGLAQGGQYGFIGVNGSVTLGGNLVLAFANGFENSVTGANTFTLLTASSPFSGSFANVVSGTRLLTSDGLGSFLVTYAGSSIILSNFSTTGLLTATFVGGTGLWNNAASWDTNPLIPQNGTNIFNVVISSGSLTQNIAGGVIIQQLTMSGGTLTLSNPLTLNTGLQFSGGTIASGTLNTAGVSNQSAAMGVASLTLNNSGTYNLNLDGGSAFAGGGTFNNSGTLAKTTGPGIEVFNITLNNTGTVAAQSGTLRLTAVGTNAGTFTAAAGATVEFASSTGFLSGSTFSGAGVIQFDNNTDTTIRGTINNSGNIVLNSTGNLTRLILGSAVQLTGGGAVNLVGGGNAQIIGSFTLTNVDNTIQGFGNLGGNSATFVNQAGGVVNANVTGQALFVDPGNAANAFVNQGLMEATNGGLLQLTGGGGGAFVNTGGVILANGAASQVQLINSVSITGGTLNTANGGGIHTTSGQVAFLSNLTNAGAFFDDNNADTHVSGAIVNTGSITMTTIGNLSRLILDANTTLTGGGTINLVGGGNAQIIGGFALTNVDNTIQGSGNLGGNSTTFLNQIGGVVNANLTGQALFVDPGNAANAFVNQGLMEATNGGLLQLTGGGGGAFVNTGATILADGATSQVQLIGNVSITGGTLATLKWRDHSHGERTDSHPVELDQRGSILRRQQRGHACQRRDREYGLDHDDNDRQPQPADS